MDTVVLKVRELFHESQDVTKWKTVATFSTIKSRSSSTQNGIMELDDVSVTMYLPVQCNNPLQLGWLFSHSKQASNGDEESRITASILDISMAVMTNSDLNHK